MVDNENSNIKYGASDHYLGVKGTAYHNRLLEVGHLNAKFNLFVLDKYINSEDTLLDFGCGACQLLQLIEARKKVGVELNPISRKYGQNLGIDVMEDTAFLQDDVFTKVITTHVLEHVPNPFAALQEFKRVLVKNGELLILVPLEYWGAPGQKDFSPDDINQHFYTWTPKLFGNLLWQAGFEPVELRILKIVPPGNHLLMQWTLRLPKLLCLLIGGLIAGIKRRRQLLVVAKIRSS